jgi:hypothetical protein
MQINERMKAVFTYVTLREGNKKKKKITGEGKENIKDKDV